MNKRIRQGLTGMVFALIGGSLVFATEPNKDNRLASETSPYLRMHADNPVDWYPWGEQAFTRARQEDKPIFLSVGYSTCYWCHVMERESFMDPDIARILNEHFISIKVDREERPDLDDIYMQAVLLINGQGGWPMSVFLTPDLKPFFGGTFFPRPHFQQLLLGIRDAWRDSRKEVVAQAERITQALRSLEREPAAAAKLPDKMLIEQAVAQLRQRFDPRYGGFGQAPKFPTVSHLELLLTAYEQQGDKEALAMADKTLDAMARGGIHDQLGGGFHRYSTDARWLVPHFEKMLYDNAQLLHVYARAYRITGNETYKYVARNIAAFIERVMTAPAGLFYSALDAETDHEEGRYYTWGKNEPREALSTDELALIERVWGLGEEPNFEGRYILYWPEEYAATAKALGLSLDDLFARLEPIRQKLLVLRMERRRPLLDDKVITAWNGLMIEALAYAGRALQESRYIERAKTAAQALLRTLIDSQGNLLHVARAGQAKLIAYLQDYAALILGLVELQSADGDTKWRAEAAKLADAMIANLWDPAAGGFFDAQPSVEHLLLRRKEQSDGAIPSGNSLAARALTKLAAMGFPDYAAYAAGTVKVFAGHLQNQPVSGAYMLWALADYQRSGFAEEAELPQQRQALVSEQFVRLQAEEIDTGPGSARILIHVKLQIDEGWHINANPASLDFLVPTEVTARIGAETVDLSPVYPPGKQLVFSPGDQSIAVYEGEVTIPISVSEQAWQAAQSQGLTVAARVQACNDQGLCLLPANLHITVLPTMDKP